MWHSMDRSPSPNWRGQLYCAALSEQGITNGKRLGKVFETVAAAVD